MGAITRIGAISRKEFRHLFRDPRMLAVVLLMPLIQLVLFSYAISFDVRNVPTVVVDQDQTTASRDYVQAYTSSGFFTVRGQEPMSAVDGLFERGQVKVAVIIGAGFQRDLDSGGEGPVAVLVDGSDPNSAQLARNYATALNRVYGQQIAVSWAERQGLDLTQLGQLEPRVRTWYNPDRLSSIFLVPGLMVVIIMLVTVQQTAVTLVREREQGTEEQMRVSPLRLPELMVGKLLPWTVLAFADMALIAALGMALYEVPLRGSVAFLLVSAAVFVFASLGLGLIVSALAPTIEIANVVGMMISFLPAFLLSGFAFPLASVPVALQVLSYAFPARPMVTISRGVFLKGAGFAELWPELGQLALYSVVVLALSVLLYARRSRR